MFSVAFSPKGLCEKGSSTIERLAVAPSNERAALHYPYTDAPCSPRRTWAEKRAQPLPTLLLHGQR